MESATESNVPQQETSSSSHVVHPSRGNIQPGTATASENPFSTPPAPYRGSASSRSRSRRQRHCSKTSTGTVARPQPSDQRFHVEQLHRLLRDMEDDKRHNKHYKFQMKLDILKDIAKKHEYIREELRKGIIKPAPMKRLREDSSSGPKTAPKRARR